MSDFLATIFACLLTLLAQATAGFWVFIGHVCVLTILAVGAHDVLTGAAAVIRATLWGWRK